MKLTVKTIKGQQFSVELSEEDKIIDLKTNIKQSQGFETEFQKIVSQGKILEDSKTLKDYNLKDGDFVVVMVSKPKPSGASVVPSSAGAGMNQQPSTAPPITTEQKSLQPPLASSTTSEQTSSTSTQPISAESNLVAGEGFENTVKEICDMGFERDQVIKALRAAFNNPDRAGIPEHLMQQQTQAQPRPGATGTGVGPSTGAGVAGVGTGAGLDTGIGANVGAGTGTGASNPLAFLANNPMFNQLRARILTDPQFFQQLMSQLQQTQPQIYQAISANPEAFLQLLLAGGGEGGEGADPPGVIRVTPEEKAAIDRLTNLGFSKQKAIEAFLACDKNEELAANYLFDHQFDEEDLGEGGEGAQNEGGGNFNTHNLLDNGGSSFGPPS